MFYNCTSLVHLSFEGLNSLESIGNLMFRECTSLVHLSFEGLNQLEKIGPVHFEKGDYLKYMLQTEAFKTLIY
jgi:hypothetical protein